MEAKSEEKKKKKDKKAKLNQQLAEEFKEKQAAFRSGGNDEALLAQLLQNPPLKGDDLEIKVGWLISSERRS